MTLRAVASPRHYSVDGAPLKWSHITATAHWRKRAHIVRFPTWSAVLLAPEVPRDTPSRSEPTTGSDDS